MSDRRRRDGEIDETTGPAGRRVRAKGRRPGAPDAPGASEAGATPDADAGPGADAGATGVPGGRVHGAWTTPAVVVRRPDGSIVHRDELRARPRLPAMARDQRPRTRAHGAGPHVAASTPTTTPSRPRPRRIPGAPGSVLLRPTLSDAGDMREERRLRRNVTASVTALPAPADRPVASDGPEAPGGPERADRVPTALASAPVATGRTSAARTKRDAVSRRRDRRVPRWRAALSQLAVDRLVPDDEEARARRAHRLRSAGVRLAAVALAAVVVLAVFPVRTWVNQRAAEERAREREEVFARENELLEDEIRDLGTDDRVEQEARELGYVRPGEEAYGVLPAPEAPTETPSSTTTTTTTRPPG